MNSLVIPKPDGGPLDALLASYCSGGLTRPMHAIVASHLAMSHKNRLFVSAMESVLADEMENIPAQEKIGARTRRLAAILDEDNVVFAPAEANSDMIPAPLAAFMGQSFDDLRWRFVLPGLREVVLESSPDCTASLLWIKAGRAMPSHTHEGLEATLVLKGSFLDSTGCFNRGDLAVADSELDHKPVAGPDQDCICFAVSEGPVHLTGPLARVFSWIKRN
ncbi:MAG: ChrR family anti-sigma-E factor [Beijerinckiaceae bacterium]